MKNAIVYKANLPTAHQLAYHLEQHPWREIAMGERKRHAFWADQDQELVTPFPGGYMLLLRTDEKILPASVVKDELDRKIKEVEAFRGKPVPRAEKAEMKDAITLELLDQALIKTRYTRAYYDEDEGLLFADTSSKPQADALLGELVVCCESVKTETIHVSEISRGLTEMLKQSIEEEMSKFQPFVPGLGVRLTRKAEGEPTERVVYTHCDIMSQEVLEQIAAGFRVEGIELGLKGTYFNLTHDFHFRRFEWADIEPFEDDADLHEISVKVALARGIVLELCELMDYQPPALEEDSA